MSAPFSCHIFSPTISKIFAKNTNCVEDVNNENPMKKHPSSLHTLVQFLEFEGFNVQVFGSLQNERKHLREEIGLAILRDHRSNFEFQEKILRPEKPTWWKIK